MQVFFAVLVSVAVGFVVQARAQSVDAVSMTCADLMSLDKQTRGDMLGGADGQTSGASGMDAQQIEALETELQGYCTEYPQASASLALAKITSE